MRIKTYKGYEDTIGVEVDGVLTIEDFIVEESAPYYDQYGFRWSATLGLRLKKEVAELIDILLPKSSQWNRSKRIEESFTQTYWETSVWAPDDADLRIALFTGFPVNVFTPEYTEDAPDCVT